MIQIKINQALLDRLREEGFFPDTMLSAYFAMRCLANNSISLLDSIDDSNTSRRTLLIYIDLVRKGIWEEDTESKLLYKFTDKGVSLLNELMEIEEGKKVDNDVSSWIGKWVALFPKGIKTGGKLLRSDVRSCEIKMKKFIKDYGYPRNIIFRATIAYLKEQQQKNWEYTRAAIYFIDKRGEGSDLAAFCSDIKEAAEEQHYEVSDQISTGLV